MKTLGLFALLIAPTASAETSSGGPSTLNECLDLCDKTLDECLGRENTYWNAFLYLSTGSDGWTQCWDDHEVCEWACETYFDARRTTK